MIFLGENRVRLIAKGYTTTHLQPETFCITAIPPIDSVASVDSVVNFDGRTGQPFEEVEFYRSEGPEGMAVAELAQTKGIPTADVPWHTFRSHITGTVEDGVPNYFVIEMTLEEGTEPFDFIEKLKLAGIFLTSGSDENGNPIHHPFFRQIASGSIQISTEPIRPDMGPRQGPRSNTLWFSEPGSKPLSFEE